MTTEKFSAQQFEQLGLDTPKAKDLSDELKHAVRDRLMEVVRTETAKIVNELNTLGHHLSIEDDLLPGELSYIDTIDGNIALRLGVDLIVSSGYAHMTKVDDISNEA